jgi:hypothetical protein
MSTSIRSTLIVAAAASLLGCGSSSEVTPGGQPSSNAGGSAASSGTSGTGNGGSANAGGSGQSAASNAGGAGQGGSGTSGAGGAGTSGAGGTGTSGAGGAGTSGAGGGTIVDGGRVTWGSTQCTDGNDNDGDGLIDARDPECTGPLDNDEGSYATGIPGDNVDQCQDCFFDGDSGQGNDGCAYPTSCFSGNDPGGAADCFNCAVSTRCVNYCQVYTPNGCDCFGCCQVNLPGGGVKTVRLSSTCTAADVNDPTKCQTCTQSTDCVNDCKPCELCLGKTTLPASCTATGGAPNAGGTPGGGGTSGAGGAPGGGGTQNAGGASTGGSNSCPTPICPAGVSPCGVSCVPDCPTNEYCLTGCCVRPPA